MRVTSFGLLPQGYCKQKTLIHENTTSSVLSVLLFIYDHNSLQNQPIFFPLILDNLSRDNLK